MLLPLARVAITPYVGAVFASLMFITPLLTGLSLAVFALIALRLSTVETVATVILMCALKYFEDTIMGAHYGFSKYVDCVSLLALFAACKVLRFTVKLNLAWCCLVTLVVFGLLSLSQLMPVEFSAVVEVIDKALVAHPEMVQSRSSTDLWLMDAANHQELVENVTIFGFAFSGVLFSGFGLTLARFWQASLFNPGGFSVEFKQLRLPPILLLALFGAMFGISMIFHQMVPAILVVLIPCALSGLTLCHWMVERYQLSPIFLVLAYIVLPLSLSVVALLGLLDSLLDFRKLMKNR